MGRYSFFIFNSCINGYSVSATGKLDNDLFGGHKRYIAVADNVGSDNQSMLDSDTLGNEQAEIQNAEDYENFEQKVGEEPLDSNEYVEEENLEVTPYFESISPYSNEWFRTIYGGPNNAYWISGMFGDYSLVPKTLPNYLTINFDILLRATQNSVKATNSRIDDVKNVANNALNKANSFESWKNSHNNWADGQRQRIDTVNAKVDTFNNRIANLESWKTSHNNWADGQRQRIDSVGNRVTTLESWRTSHNSWANNLSERVDRIVTWKDSHNTWANNLSERVDRIVTWKDSHNTWANNLSERVDRIVTWKDSHNAWADTQRQRIDTNANSISSQDKRIITLEEWRKSHNTWANTLSDKVTSNGLKITNQADRIVTLEEWRKSHNTWADTQRLRIDNAEKDINANTASIGSQDKRIITLEEWRKSHNSWANTLSNKVDSVDKKVESFKTDQTIINLANSLAIADLQNDLSALNTKVDNLSWSDVGIITALVAVKDSIDNFKKDFNDLFGSNGELGLNAYEGKFTSMLKHQFIALRNDIRDLFSSKGTFWTDLKTLLDIYFDINNKDSGFYRIRYSIVSGFMDLQEVLETIGTDTLNIRKQLLTMTDLLILTTDWLKLIYDKPVGNVVVPPIDITPFDYDRLQKMFDDLEFSDFYNGKGEGGWLKQLIKTVGGIIETAIKTMGDVLKSAIDGVVSVAEKILDLLGKFVDTVLSLIIPKDWDFLDNGFGDIKGKFDVKFKSFLDLGYLVKGLFKPTKRDFLKAISFTWFGVNFDFTKSQPFLDLYVPKFRLAMAVIVWALTAVYIYRKFTGTGDVINDN